MTHTPDPNEAIQRFLGQWSPLTRAEALHLALQSLRDRVEPDRVLACELAWEVHAKGYWSQVRNADGTTYPTEEDYFRHVLGLASWRTAYKRLAIGRMLTRFEEPERSLLRSSLAAVGLAKATVVAPAIERFGGVADLASVRKRTADGAPAGEGFGGARCPPAGSRAGPSRRALPAGRAERHAGHRGDGVGRTLLPPREARRGLAEPDRDLPGGLPRMSPGVGTAGRQALAGTLLSVRFVRLPPWANLGLTQMRRSRILRAGVRIG